MEIFLAILLIVGMIILFVGTITGEDRGKVMVVLGGILFVLGLWGVVAISFKRDKSTYEIKTNKPITPELRITVKDSVTIDTIYVYKIKD